MELKLEDAEIKDGTYKIYAGKARVFVDVGFGGEVSITISDNHEAGTVSLEELTKIVAFAQEAKRHYLSKTIAELEKELEAAKTQITNPEHNRWYLDEEPPSE